MCGIAVIINGIQFDLSALFDDYAPPPCPNSQQPLFAIGDLEEALRRRGPDSLGSRRVVFRSRCSGSDEGCEVVSFLEECRESLLENGVAEEIRSGIGLSRFVAEMWFVGATLQLRGADPIVQPLVDEAGNVLVYNGEIFGGVLINKESNDAQVLMKYLGGCCSNYADMNPEIFCGNGELKNSIANILSTIKGPWAIIYWQNSSKTLWFGRDAFGRRSLLVHWPTKDDPRLLLSSVSPPSSVKWSSGSEVISDSNEPKYWEELPCGIYSIAMDAAMSDGCLVGEIKKHEWTNSELRDLIKWERIHVTPNSGELTVCEQHVPQSISFDIKQSKLALTPVETVLTALRESVRRRTSLYKIFQVSSGDKQKELVPVAVLFSGGLDSMILAALLNECLDPIYEIDLLNISFDGSSAPDRISARAGVSELKRVAPKRRWNLVEIDAVLSKLKLETERVTSLIYPANTYMDLNIGLALWLAAGGDGWLYENVGNGINEDHKEVKYKSKARILLVGSGADEQCAGYGRHRTKYRNGSWLGLYEEMKLDMQRIWRRNLGRDDRLIADNGKEARFPFLDEDVIRTLLKIPLWEVADLNQPSGKGDKKILREVARLLGLHDAAGLPKRAIQFGSRIARESNRKNFGSNRAANQASAGSVSFYKPLKPVN